MIGSIKFRWPAAVGIGLVVGLLLSGFWPNTPLHAVSTDRVDTYAMATGPVDTDVEAVYFLDFLTGDLAALVLGKKPGGWSGFFRTNVSADLEVDPQKNPKYMMVTGVVGLRRAGGSRQQPSSSVCYVAEVNSGRVAAYAIPWSPPMYAAGQPQTGALIAVGKTYFRQALGGSGAGPGGAVIKGKVKEKEKDNEKDNQ
jgi:hypothetical protein